MPAVRQLCHSVHTVSSIMDRELLKLRKHVLVTVLCWTEMKHCSFQVLPRLPPLGAIAFIAIMRRCDSDPILHLRASLTSRVQSIGSWVRTTWVCFLDSFFFFFPGFLFNAEPIIHLCEPQFPRQENRNKNSI